jgi:hypothetical protein
MGNAPLNRVLTILWDVRVSEKREFQALSDTPCPKFVFTFQSG